MVFVQKFAWEALLSPRPGRDKLADRTGIEDAMAPLDTAAADKSLLPRGKVGNTPALPHRADEVFMDFVSDARNFLMHAQTRSIDARADEILTEAEKRTGRRPNSPDAVKEAVKGDPYIGTFLRVK